MLDVTRLRRPRLSLDLSNLAVTPFFDRSVSNPDLNGPPEVMPNYVPWTTKQLPTRTSSAEPVTLDLLKRRQQLSFKTHSSLPKSFGKTWTEYNKNRFELLLKSEKSQVSVISNPIRNPVDLVDFMIYFINQSHIFLTPFLDYSLAVDISVSISMSAIDITYVTFFFFVGFSAIDSFNWLHRNMHSKFVSLCLPVSPFPRPLRPPHIGGCLKVPAPRRALGPWFFTKLWKLHKFTFEETKESNESGELDEKQGEHRQEMFQRNAKTLSSPVIWQPSPNLLTVNQSFELNLVGNGWRCLEMFFLFEFWVWFLKGGR